MNSYQHPCNSAAGRLPWRNASQFATWQPCVQGDDSFDELSLRPLLIGRSGDAVAAAYADSSASPATESVLQSPPAAGMDDDNDDDFVDAEDTSRTFEFSIMDSPVMSGLMIVIAIMIMIMMRIIRSSKYCSPITSEHLNI